MSKRKGRKKKDLDDEEEELDWLSGSFTTVMDEKYEADFGDVFSDEDEEDEEAWDADDYILMADDDESDEDY